MSAYLNKDKFQLDFFCPVCGNDKFNRIPRNIFEKSVYYLTFGKNNAKKYECINCKWTVLPAKKQSK